MTIWTEFAEQSSSSAWIVALTPLVIGGAMTIFKPWIPGEEAIAKKIDLAKSTLRVKLETSLRRVMSDFDSYSMQEEGAIESDALPSYSTQLMTTIRLFHHLESVRQRILKGHLVLIITTILAILLCLVALISQQSRPYVALISALTILCQIYYILRMHHANRSLIQEVSNLES